MMVLDPCRTMAVKAREPAPSSQRVVRFSQIYDSRPQRILDAPSPKKMAGLLERIDHGEIGLLCQMQMEMERKCDHFAGVVQTRRNAIAGLDWTVEPDPRFLEDDALARETADYVSSRLSDIESWEDALMHLSYAIGPNLAVVEILWDGAEVVDFVVVPYKRLRSHWIKNTGVSILTDDVPLGIPTEDLFSKFIVFVPHSRGGFPFRSTLTHASVNAYLGIHFSVTDWLAFSELYGTPFRYGIYDETVIPADYDAAKKMLDEMGTDTAAMIPRGIKPEFFQAGGTGETYQKQLSYFASRMAILWRGQVLTTENTDTGSRALGEIQADVAVDIRDADLKAEAACIRRQLLRPMVHLKYPGRNVPVPVFRRKVGKKRDVESERLTLEQLRFARESNLYLDDAVLYEKLSLPRPGSIPMEKTVAVLDELTLEIERAVRMQDFSLVSVLRERIGTLLGLKKGKKTNADSRS